MGHTRTDFGDGVTKALLELLAVPPEVRRPVYDDNNTPILLTDVTGEGRVLVAVFVPDMQAAKNTGGLGIYLSEQLTALFDAYHIVGTDRDGDPVRVTFDIDLSLLRLTKPIRL